MFSKKNFAAVIIVSAGTLMGFAADNQVVGSSGLTAQQIVEKNVAARGGIEAWRSIQTMTMVGDLDAGKGVKLPFVLELKRPRKSRLEVRFHGDTAVQVYDGVNGWKVRPFLGHKDAMPFTAEEKKEAALQADLDGLLLDYERKGSKVKLEGIENVDDHEAYKLAVTLSNGEVRHAWVDTKTFLELKVDGTRRADGKNRTVETYLSDYKSVQGRMLPSLMKTEIAGVQGSEEIRIESFALNPKLDDAIFSKP